MVVQSEISEVEMYLWIVCLRGWYREFSCPQKAEEAYSIRVSGCTSHMSRSFISMTGVIGSLVRVWRPELASTRLIPPKHVFQAWHRYTYKRVAHLMLYLQAANS